MHSPAKVRTIVMLCRDAVSGLGKVGYNKVRKSTDDRWTNSTRHLYRDAFRGWHARIEAGGDAYLPFVHVLVGACTYVRVKLFASVLKAASVSIAVLDSMQPLLHVPVDDKSCSGAKDLPLQLPPADGRVVARIVHQLADVAAPTAAVGGLREFRVLAKPGGSLHFDVAVRVTPRRGGDDGVADGGAA